MIKAVHIGSQSLDVFTNSQGTIDAVITALNSAIPNLSHIVIGTYMDYDSTSANNQFLKWATAIHNVGKRMWIRSAGFNDFNGKNNIPQFVTNTSYVVNPYLDSNTNYWATGGAMTKAYSTAEHYEGAGSLKYDGTAVADSVYCTFADAGTAIVGHSYTFTVFLKGSGTVNLVMYDGVTDQYSSNIVLTGTWTQYTKTATCQAVGMLGGVRINSANTVSGYLDNVFWTDDATSADTFDNHSVTKYTSFINNNFGIFKSGDILEPLPDEPENCSNWTRVYGGLGAPTGDNAYNAFITASINAANTALANNGVTGVTTNYVFTSPSATKDVITQAKANTLAADGTDDYPENSTTTPTTMRDAMITEIDTWLIPAHTSPNRPKHITFGPNVYSQLSDADQAFTLKLEYDKIYQKLSLDGVTIWQFGATDNAPKSRLFDWSGSVWTPRDSAKMVAKLFDSRYGFGNNYRTVIVGSGMSRSEGAT